MTGSVVSQTTVPVDPVTLAWLLEEENAPIRYFTLTDILGEQDTSPDVAKTYEKIPVSDWARKMLEGQQERAYWESSQSCYVPKFTATVWRLIVLSELGMSGHDPEIKNACEHFLRMHNVDDGGFSLRQIGSTEAAPHICMTGNMVRTLVKFNYGGNSRVQKAASWLLSQQQKDGGWDCYREGSRGHSSFSSTIQPLWALSEISQRERKSEVQESVEKAVEFFLRHKLYRSDRNDEIIMLDWTLFHHPIHYFYDVLHALGILTSLGVTEDKRLSDAVELLISKRTDGGTWELDGVPRGWHIEEGFHASDSVWRPEEREVVKTGWGGQHTLQLEEAGQPSKMITLNALRVLKNLDLLRLPENGYY